MPITIHNASKNQVESLVSKFREIISPLTYYNETAKEHELSKYTIDELYKKIETDPESVIVAEDDGSILGFCFSRIDDMTIWLEWFGVCEVARGKGIAKKIVGYLEETAGKRDAHKIWCDCRTENMKSINLLSTCGYTPVCTLKNHWYKQDFIIWQKEI